LCREIELVPNYYGHWFLATTTALIVAILGAWAYLKLEAIDPHSLGLRVWLAAGVALLIVLGKMILKGCRNKEFKLYEQGEENALLAVGAAVPTAADHFVQHSTDALKWGIFAGVTMVCLLFAILASTAAGNSPVNSGARSGWTVACIVLGSGSFLLYMFLVVLKVG
jgi:hypothetical protein